MRCASIAVKCLVVIKVLINQSLLNHISKSLKLNLSVNPHLTLLRVGVLNPVMLNTFKKYRASGPMARKEIELRTMHRGQHSAATHQYTSISDQECKNNSVFQLNKIWHLIFTWHRLYSSQHNMWNVTKCKDRTNVILWPVLTDRHTRCVYNNQMHPLLLSPPPCCQWAGTYYHSPFSIINYLFPLTSAWSCVSSHNTLAILMMSDLK